MKRFNMPGIVLTANEIDGLNFAIDLAEADLEAADNGGSSSRERKLRGARSALVKLSKALIQAKEHPWHQ